MFVIIDGMTEVESLRKLVNKALQQERTQYNKLYREKMVNQVTLVGRLGADPECKTLTSGNSVANVSLATTESWKDKDTGQKKEVTDWHRVVVYGALAEVFSRWLHKGSLIYVQGRLKTRSWDDQKAGGKRYITEVICDQMRMLGGKKEDGGHAQDDIPPAEPEGQAGSDEEGLPF